MIYSIYKNKTIIILSALLFLFAFRIYSYDIVVCFGDEEIKHNSTFNFNKIPADYRTEKQDFTIKNNSIDTNLVIHEIKSEGINRNEFELDYTYSSESVIPGNTITFGVRFTSNTKDGKLKKCIIKIYNNFMDDPYLIEFTGTAKSSGVLLFKEVGTYYWKSPYDVTAFIDLMGGGQGGYNGSGTPSYQAGYYNQTTLYNHGNGGAGGSSGSYINKIDINFTTDTVYTIVVGAGGTGGGGHGGDSEFFGGATTIIAAGGQGLPDQAPGENGRVRDGDYNGAGGSGGNYTGDPFEFDPADGASRTKSEGNGKSGSDAPPNSGNGGGGGSGGNSGGDRRDYHSGGPGGAGGSGYVRIQWSGFLY